MLSKSPAFTWRRDETGISFGVLLGVEASLGRESVFSKWLRDVRT